MEKVEHLIIGAGPAGIAAALRLGKQAKVVDRNPFAGGQSASIQIGEAVFDIGGHSFHTPHPFVRDLVYNSLEMYDQVRNAKCFSHGKMISYPFQKNFREIEIDSIVQECAEGLQEVNTQDTPANFKEFITNRFGPGISKHFMLPYNTKLWARDLTKLDAHWVGERVAAPEGVKEKFDLEGGKRKPLQANTKVGYPAKGGFGEIYKVLASKVTDMELGLTIANIDFRNKIAYTTDNRSFQYEHLISTIPLNEFFQLLENPSELIQQAVDTLEYMSLKCILVAINHPVDTDIQRVYAADSSIPAHKTAINHNSSDWLRQRKHHGIMGEVSYSAFKQFPRTDLKEWFLDGLIQMDIIKSRKEVLDAKIIDVKYAYPVPTHDRKAIVEQAKSFLLENDIHTLGRFGEWAYINSDEALARGMILGEQLVGVV